MVVNWLMFDSVVAVFVLGLDGASASAVPLGTALLWMMTLASGKLDRLFELPQTAIHWLYWLQIAVGSLARCTALVIVDFEMGRAAALVTGLEIAS